MIRTHYFNEINEKDYDKEITLAGWAQSVRVLGKISFIKLRDKTGVSQVTIPASNSNFNLINEITPESVLAVTGFVKKNEKSLSGWELIPSKIEVLNKAEVPLPIDFSGKVNTSLDKKIDYRYLDARNKRNLLIRKILSTVETSMKQYLINNGFLEINTPKMMSVASETGAELFSVDYFKTKAYLAQSPQFYKQMAIASGFDKVFEQGPVFRAEESHTPRHLTEFISFDVEMAFIDSYEDIMRLQEELLVFVFKQVKEKYGKEIMNLFGVNIQVPETPFPRITMKEAHEKLFQLEVVDEFGDLDTKGEKKLSEYVKKEFNHDFVFLTDFPYSVRPFYHMKKEGNLTMSYDLIYKGLELSTAAQREHRYEKLIAQAKEKGINEKNNKFYLDMFRYGVPPHGGFGFGPERLVMQMLNLENIREVVFLPRDPERLTP